MMQGITGIGIAVLAVQATESAKGGRPSDTLLIYERIGGVVYERPSGVSGFSDHMIIHENGTVILSRWEMTIQFTLDQGTMDRVRRLLDAAHMQHLSEKNPSPQMKSSYEDAGFDADYPRHVVRHGGYVVNATDDNIPVELTPLVELLMRIIADYGPHNP